MKIKIYHLISVRMVVNKTEKDSKCWQGCGQRESLYSLLEMFISIALKKTIWKAFRHCKQNWSVTFLCFFSKEIKSVCWRDVYTLIFIVVLFTMANIWNKLKYTPAKEWIFSLKKERNPELCENIEELRGQFQ